jgi:hypothetical protein
MAFALVFSLMFLIPLVVFILVFATRQLLPNFFKLKVKRLLDGSICVFGWLSPLILFTVGATTHDIWYDYVSSPLYSNYGTALPSWYVASVHSCLGEWRALLVAFVLIVAFHMLLFARFLVVRANKQDG